MQITIGTRGSRLALAQTDWVARLIQSQNPGVEVNIRRITTTGDIVRDLALDKIQTQGIFTQAIEAALLGGEIDLAVHSMKDMPSQIGEGLALACIPKREDPRDALVLREGFAGLDALPPGARLGTGSKRRACQLARLRPDVEAVPIRGNIETRIGKIASGEVDGVVLAAAGLARLGLAGHIAEYLPAEAMIPACGQGALALQIRADRQDVWALLRPLGDPRAELETAAERAFLAGVNGGCHLPVGARCTAAEGRLTMTGLLGTEDARVFVARTLAAPCPKSLAPEEAAAAARALGTRLAQETAAALAREVGT